jgi:hypothetical protein
MTGDRDDWDDDRLAAAFGVRASGRSTPPDLMAGALERVQAAGRRQPMRLSRAPIALLATAAAVAVLVGIVGVSPRHSGPAATATATAPATTVYGMPILSVAEAIAVRDSPPTDREIAVRGYVAPASRTFGCARPFDAARNPIRMDCPGDGQWLVDAPSRRGPIPGTLPPDRVGFPSVLPFLDRSPLDAVTATAPAGNSLAEVVLIGHFHDRRGVPALCDVPDPAACAGFVVDAIFSIDGRLVPSSTVVDLEPLPGEPRREPAWTTADVDRLVLAALPQLQVLSRVALPGHRIHELEPALGTGALGIIDRPIAWVVTGIEPGAGGGPSVRRTLLIVDGTAEAYESVPWSISDVGFTPFPLAPLPPEPTPSPTAPASAPVAVLPAGAPTSVFGLPVLSLSEALLRAPEPGLVEADTELAVAGYFIQPPGAIDCPPVAGTPGPIGAECPTGLRWLTEAPQRLPIGPTGRFAEPARRPALNPVIRPEVPFEIPDGWFANGSEPLPVVVVGHFADRRAGTFSDNGRFVVDALVWRAGAMTHQAAVMLGVSPAESVDAVLTRIDGELGPATSAWVTVVRGSDLASVDPESVGHMRELERSDTVWIVRRLVTEGGRPVVRSAYTADGGTRVWAETEFAQIELVTRIEVPAGSSDRGPVTVEVIDGPDMLAGARPVTASDLVGVTWTERAGSDWVIDVELAPVPGSDDEIVVRWLGGMCDEVWRLEVYGAFEGHKSSLFPYQVNGPDSCRMAGITRTIVVRYRNPMSVEDIGVIQNPSGG